MSLCLIAGTKVATLAVAAFTLSWTHSVEKVIWQESWQVSPAGLELVEARVKGSGAGMEPGENAVLQDGWWVWAPDLQPQKELHLAASGKTVSGWKLCAGEECFSLGNLPSPTIKLTYCE